MDPKVIEKLQAIERRYDDLATLMGQPEAIASYERVQALSKERAFLEDTVLMYRDYRKTAGEMEGVRSILAEGNDEDLVDSFRRRGG